MFDLTIDGTGIFYGPGWPYVLALSWLICYTFLIAQWAKGIGKIDILTFIMFACLALVLSVGWPVIVLGKAIEWIVACAGSVIRKGGYFDH